METLAAGGTAGMAGSVAAGAAASLATGITTIRGVATSRRALTLTFDDGPDPTHTPQKLSMLSGAGAQATFFCLGKLIDPRPDLVGSIVAAGCEVGNHSYSHPYLTGLGYGGAYGEIDRARQSILRAGGGFALYFRPPYGDFNSTVLGAAQDAGYLYNVLWNVDPRDWERPSADAIIARVVGAAAPGSIVIMHDWVPETVWALPSIVSQLRADGYELVTLSALLGATPPPPPPPLPSQCRRLSVQNPYIRGDDVLAVQQALVGRGYSPGPVDGVYGPRTASAVRAFQATEGLPVTGVVTAAEYARLAIVCP